MPKIVLAIDDDPIRYRKLAKALHPKGITVIITHQLSEVLHYISEPSYEIVGVCLDHDMPRQSGEFYAKNVLGDHAYPVVIVSMNPAGAKNIAAVLKSAYVDHTIAPASHEDWWVNGIIRFFEL